MQPHKNRSYTKVGAALLLLRIDAVACLPATPTSGGADAASDTPTATSGTSPGDDGDSAAEGPSSGISTTTTGDSTLGDSSTGAFDGLPNGAMCETHAECASQKCFSVPHIAGFCSECLVDRDCDDGGCSLPVILAEPPLPALCNTGVLGKGCMSDAACQDPLFCVMVLDVPSVIQASGCSECRSDDDCGSELCTIRYHILEIEGEWVCVPPGTVPNGEGCNHLGSGDQACASGICAPVSIQGLTEVGICGDCRTDDDCTPPQVCQKATAEVVTGTVHPATCVDP